MSRERKLIGKYNFTVYHLPENSFSFTQFSLRAFLVRIIANILQKLKLYQKFLSEQGQKKINKKYGPSYTPTIRE